MPKKKSRKGYTVNVKAHTRNPKVKAHKRRPQRKRKKTTKRSKK